MTSDITLVEDEVIKVSAPHELVEPWEVEDFSLPVPYRALMWKAGIQGPVALAPNVYIGIDARSEGERQSDDGIDSTIAPIRIGRSSEALGRNRSSELFVGNFQGQCVFQCSGWLEDPALIKRRVQIVGTCGSDLIQGFSIDFDHLVNGLDLREVGANV